MSQRSGLLGAALGVKSTRDRRRYLVMMHFHKVRRREFITLLGGAATTWPLGVRAQQATKTYRIGFVGLPSADSLPQRPEAFRAGLRDLGYQEGRDIVIEYR